jgi:hypothetical protein
MSTGVDRLLASAMRRTGLTDWGDMAFAEPLQALVDSFEIDGGRADAPTKEGFRIEIVELLSTRLQLQRDLVRHPDILDVHIRKPLVVVGLPRSGTALLQNLLAQDPSCRYLAFWEVLSPSPPPNTTTWATDRRIRRAEDRLRRLQGGDPALIEMRERTACAPEDCRGLFDYTFFNDFNAKWPVPSYQRWLQSQDRSPAYRYYHHLLNHLTWRCPGRHLVLMSPSHLAHLDCLFQVLPDANVVWLHRDLMAVIPSICSLRSTMRGLTPYGQTLGWAVLRQAARAVQVAMAARERQPSGQFHDVLCEELISTPCEVVRRIYQVFGYDWPDDMATRVARWLEQHPRRRRGTYRHGLHDYGLDPDIVTRELRDYFERFGNHGRRESRNGRSAVPPLRVGPWDPLAVRPSQSLSTSAGEG